MSELNEIKRYLRDINLDILTNHQDVKVDISKRYNTRFRLFYPSRKLINSVIEIGGVLVGSRALRCYTISGKPILERRVKDWDFVVTLDQAFRICDKMKINQIPSVGSIISVKNQRRWVHPSYSDSYRVGPVDVQIIVKDELPDYTEEDGIKIGTFGYSVSQKISLTDELNGDEYDKHISDLKEIIIKFNSIKL
jgi:hypothetical protein